MEEKEILNQILENQDSLKTELFSIVGLVLMMTYKIVKLFKKDKDD